MTTKLILTLLCILMLVAGAARLAILDRKELQLYRSGQNESALSPGVGSFIGIGARADRKEATIDGNGHLLVFAIHHDRIAGDVQYWNSVIHSLSLNPKIPGASFQYWGICDAGAACNQQQLGAKFDILGYLDPYEMRIVAEADGKNKALLYGQFNQLEAYIERATDASAEANLVAQGAKPK